MFHNMALFYAFYDRQLTNSFTHNDFYSLH
jgi:hypothetical protein